MCVKQSNKLGPTAAVSAFCVLSSASVCWGNTHRLVEVVANGPLNDIYVGPNCKPAFGDLDADGDYDLVVGKSDGTLSYYENVGSPSVPRYSRVYGAANPVDGIDVGNGSTPTLRPSSHDPRNPISTAPTTTMAATQ